MTNCKCSKFAILAFRQNDIDSFVYNSSPRNTSKPNNSPQSKDILSDSEAFNRTESKVESDDRSTDGFGDRIENALTKNHKILDKTLNAKHRRFKIRCTAANRGNCREAFESWNAMKYHASTYHARGIKKTFSCYLCRRSFPRPHRIQEHIDSVHCGSKPFPCPNHSCSEYFSFRNNLKRHIDSVHLEIKPFQCQNGSCLKRFSRKYNLKKHINSVHTGLKPING